MLPRDAFEMGYCAAAPGYFFDSLELLAAVSVDAGGFDRLETHLREVLAQRERTAEQLRFVTELATAAFRRPHEVPTTVDGYRVLLTASIFEIVNRWSFIADIHTVTRLQAWFYAGFGLGRLETVARGVSLFCRLRDDLGLIGPLPRTPVTLARMATEAARQMGTASAEADFDRVRPLFVDLAARADALTLRLGGPPESIEPGAVVSEILERCSGSARQVRLDLMR